MLDLQVTFWCTCELSGAAFRSFPKAVFLKSLVTTKELHLDQNRQEVTGSTLETSPSNLRFFGCPRHLNTTVVVMVSMISYFRPLLFRARIPIWRAYFSAEWKPPTRILIMTYHAWSLRFGKVGMKSSFFQRSRSRHPISRSRRQCATGLVRQVLSEHSGENKWLYCNLKMGVKICIYMYIYIHVGIYDTSYFDYRLNCNTPLRQV